MELWHVLNRGVEKRNIFLDVRDRFRFVHGLLLFNTKRPANNTTYILSDNHNDFRSRYDPEERIVDVHGWCLMKNHYHLLLSDKVDGGLTLFLRKLNIGYAKYFNERYDRDGALFQGKTKKVPIRKDAHFLHILNYIHLNPLDFDSANKGWRNVGIKDLRGASTYLAKYRWSSYQDYCGHKNFPSVTNTEYFSGFFKNVKSSTEKYLKDIQLDSSHMLE
ncbi:transposase [Candidatus Kaiserbacteria bacterium]|nr:transposase [Candidatus Kaiserbacteria bacterium]